MSFFHKIFGTVAALNPMTGAEMLAAKEARRLTQHHGHPHVVARLPGGRFMARPAPYGGGYAAPPAGGGGYVAPPAPPDPSAGTPDPSAGAADPSGVVPDPSAAATPDPSAAAATPDPTAAGASMGFDSDLDSFHDGLSHFLSEDGLEELVLTDNFHGHGGGGGGGRGGGGRGWGPGWGGGWGYGYPYGYPDYDEEVIYPAAVATEEGPAPVVIVRRGSPWGMRG